MWILVVLGLACSQANALELDDATLADSLETQSLRQLGSSTYECPSDSRPRRNRPRKFDHCRCDSGFERDEDLEACVKWLYLDLTNLAIMQPNSPFLVVSHNEYAPKLFVPGHPARDELRSIAEMGDATSAQALYEQDENTLTSSIGSPIAPGGNATIKVAVNSAYPLVTLAAMCGNTNDCFVAVNGMHLYPGQVLYQPGWDAGTELNNELCTFVPGPACPAGSGNGQTETGEGYVHIHPGFHGVNKGRTDLSADELGADGEPLGTALDWRNPMLQVVVSA